MLNGKEKATLLFSLLGEKGKEILGYLSQETVSELTHLLDEAPEKNNANIALLLGEIKRKFRSKPKPAPVETVMPSIEQSSLGNSFGDEGQGFFGEEEEEAPKVEVKPILKPGDLRPIEKIVQILSKQKPQIIAFILSKIEESLKENIIEKLEPALRDKIEAINVAKTPLSENVFKKIYQDIFVCSEKDFEEPEEETPPSVKNNDTTSTNDEAPVVIPSFPSLETAPNPSAFSLTSNEEAPSQENFGFGNSEESNFSFGGSDFSFGTPSEEGSQSNFGEIKWGS